jgi:hypothetical protein
MTQDEIIEMARQAGFVEYELDDGTTNAFDKRYEAFAKLVEERAVAKERKACLKICEAQAWTNYWEGADVCADAIRARGEA